MWIKYKNRSENLHHISYIKATNIFGTTFYDLNNKQKLGLFCGEDILIEQFDIIEEMVKELNRFEEAILYKEKMFITLEVKLLEN